MPTWDEFLTPIATIDTEKTPVRARFTSESGEKKPGVAARLFREACHKS